MSSLSSKEVRTVRVTIYRDCFLENVTVLFFNKSLIRVGSRK